MKEPYRAIGPEEAADNLTYSVSQAARVLCLSQSEVWGLVRDGYLRVWKCRSKTLFRRRDLLTLIENDIPGKRRQTPTMLRQPTEPQEVAL